MKYLIYFIITYLVLSCENKTKDIEINKGNMDKKSVIKLYEGMKLSELQSNSQIKWQQSKFKIQEADIEIRIHLYKKFKKVNSDAYDNIGVEITFNYENMNYIAWFYNSRKENTWICLDFLIYEQGRAY